MRHGILPKTLHVDEPTPHVDWSSGHVRLLTEQQPWPDLGRPRRAAVSSFGISGTNAHVILEEPPRPERPPRPARPSIVAWALSARTRNALSEQASRLRAHLRDNPGLDAADVAAALARRTAFEHRAVITGDSTAELLDGLTDLDGHAATGTAGKTAFVFTGQGSQRLGMGRQLHAAHPVFAEAWDEVEDALGLRVRDIAWGDRADDLTRTLHAQTALFALHVAGFRLLESWRVLPDFVIGHSIGEIAAAHAAGVLTLSDAATVVTARARLMQSLPSGGAMLAVHAAEQDVAPLLAEDVEIAAVNGPAATVVAGPVDAVGRLEKRAGTAGYRTKTLAVSHAFHSAAMTPVLDELRTALAGIAPTPARIPLAANLTGELAGDGYGTAEYWVRHVRDTVRFGRGIATLADRRAARYLEIGPHSGLTGHITETAPTATTIALLRPDRPEPRSVHEALGALHTSGHTVDWTALYPRRPHGTALPTYPFEHRTYWQARPATGDATGHGLRPIDHPLLSAALDEPGTTEVRLTGRLSLATHPWLADHAILGRPLLPGTAFVEMALRAADEVGCTTIRELTLHVPLPIPPDAAVRLHVLVRDTAAGERSVRIASCRDDADDWTTHAEGTLAATNTSVPPPDSTPWPPSGAAPVDLGNDYDDLAALGYEYGPAFRGVRAAWRHGERSFAEVALPGAADTDASAYAVHPALLDAATHPALLEGGDLVLPFAWTGVTLHASHASELRATGIRQGPGRMSLRAVDPSGNPVLTVESVIGRPFTPDQLNASGQVRGALFTTVWQPVPAAEANGDNLREWPAAGSSGDTVVVPVAPGGTETLTGARHRLADLLEVIQRWSADPDAARLLVLTRGAVARPGEDVHDLAVAPVWGLVRSAQAEHPGRIMLADTDDTVDPARLAATGEPEMVARDSQVWVPRLSAVPGTDNDDTPAVPIERLRTGTVLITGGTGVLGALVARHLVDAYGAGSLVLIGRRGESAPGAEELAADLAGKGARVRIVSCDVADRDALARVLAEIPDDRPLTGIVHAAGLFDTGVVAGLTADRLDATLRAKADGAWHLHELTRDRDLSLFALFSSVGGLILAGGQAAYAAANVFLDALAAHRRAHGLAATSLAWGPWADARMGTEVSEQQAQRIRRQGVAPLPTASGLRLLDAALAADEAVVVPMAVDRAALRVRTGDLPAQLRGLTAAPARAVAAGPDREAALRERLRPLTVAQRRHQLRELVRGVVAAVLSYRSSAEVPVLSTFQDLGFDSLSAMEFRERIRSETGLPLPVTLVFDHPTPEELADHLVTELGLGQQAASDTATGAVPTPVSDSGTAEFDSMDAGALVRHVLAGPRRTSGGE
ncbi:type I polyketide synthase [Nocardia wallacei]|uniref:type I polyketide synthase n=1 Tax=Nocardia wallacei TaxID=480035 RepID=UPI0024559587|nr:type I polyketide synthase [Nocardia wallacei]